MLLSVGQSALWGTHDGHTGAISNWDLPTFLSQVALFNRECCLPGHHFLKNRQQKRDLKLLKWRTLWGWPLRETKYNITLIKPRDSELNPLALPKIPLTLTSVGSYLNSLFDLGPSAEGEPSPSARRCPSGPLPRRSGRRRALRFRTRFPPCGGTWGALRDRGPPPAPPAARAPPAVAPPPSRVPPEPRRRAAPPQRDELRVQQLPQRWQGAGERLQLPAGGRRCPRRVLLRLPGRQVLLRWPPQLLPLWAQLHVVAQVGRATVGAGEPRWPGLVCESGLRHFKTSCPRGQW